MIDLKNIISRFMAVYDKLIAFVVLLCLVASFLYLAVQIGMINSRQKKFEKRIRELKPKYEHAVPVDTALFEQAMEEAVQPSQVPAWTNAVFVPETRVWCTDCKRPIRLRAMICPFCGTKQPDIRNPWTWDTDRDGIPDKWEERYGLDPLDPSDAEKDNDGDGFPNIIEFRAEPRTNLKDPSVEPGTDMNDPNDFPPLEHLLALERIKIDPFKLKFKSVIKLPDSSLKFALNTRGDKKTYFAKMGAEVEGFKLVKYESKSERKRIGGILRKINISELTLKRGNKLIVLVRGRDVLYRDYIVRLVFLLDDSKYVMKMDDSFELKEKKYKLIEVDSRGKSVVILRVHDGKRFDIRMLMLHEIEAVGKSTDDSPAGFP